VDNRAEFVRRISGILTLDEPIELVPSETAAVAVIFGDAPTGEEKILLIRRPVSKDDPWSGQVALPGGRVAISDNSFRITASRETGEEVGIELEKSARFLGYLGPFQARTRSIWVVAAVFVTDGIPLVVPSGEVASYKWMPFLEVIAQSSRSTYELDHRKGRRTFPAFERDGYLIWGLTERIISTLASAVQKGVS
jgi:8-oxo-dGTP pyrophosphatase MutT (NUDIX family)